MTIDGTNISTFGLKLAAQPNIHDIPPLKSILENWNSAAELAVHQEYDIDITMFGKYATTALLTTAVTAFTALLRASVTHVIVITELSLTTSAVAKNGFKTRIYGHKYNFLEITIKLTRTI